VDGLRRVGARWSASLRVDVAPRSLCYGCSEAFGPTSSAVRGLGALISGALFSERNHDAQGALGCGGRVVGDVVFGFQGADRAEDQ
jgi:hypothetical protein